MKNIVFFLVAAVLIYLPTSGFTNGNVDSKQKSSERAQDWFLERKNVLNTQLLKLEQQLSDKKEAKVIIASYQNVRSSFKTIEFLIAYLDPQEYSSYINGAPLPKLMKKIPEQIVIEPNGFQRLDELIFEEAIDYQATSAVVQKLRYHLNTFSEQTLRFQLSDPVIFEAASFGILRIQTMGITGFDRPGNTDGALKETALSLIGIAEVMRFYQSYMPTAMWSEFQTMVTTADTLLRSASFETFDRVHFHKTSADPLWTKLLEMQKALYIELPHQRHNVAQPVNYESESLFGNNFLNANFYAQYADDLKDDKRITLGKILFFDPILSRNNERACASCHHPDKAFTDGLSTSRTNTGKQGLRNAPTIINSVYAERFFHDLRTDHLAGQMDHVVFNDEEFNTDYPEIIGKLKSSQDYVKYFMEAYGKEGITKNSVSHAVTRYVASLRSYNSLFDRYMRGETEKIDPNVIRGYNLFSGKAACATCHFAPTFAGLVPPNFLESESEVLGVPKIFKKPYELDSDQGRYMNYILKEQAPFYRYSFKTPTLRNVELTAPYMHNGSMVTLEDVMEFYNKGGGIGLGLDVPHQTLPADELELTDEEIEAIISFLKSLTDTTGMNYEPTDLPKFSQAGLNQRVPGGVY